jgi:Ca2+-transporting ATPase
MFILLLACGTVYLLLGDYSEGVILLSWVLVIISITFWQHRKTEKSLEALKQLSSPRALVIRDGKEVSIPGREVVPGDILLLHEGDRVPADAQVLESEHLTLDESLLTGESAPVLKTDQAVSEVYSGTLVVQGKGMARVVRTGVKTSFGKIGVSLKSIEPDGTRLQREMKSLIRNLFLAGEMLGPVLASIHNLTFYQRLVARLREAVVAGRFEAVARGMLDSLLAGEERV